MQTAPVAYAAGYFFNDPENAFVKLKQNFEKNIVKVQKLFAIILWLSKLY